VVGSIKDVVNVDYACVSKKAVKELERALEAEK
jgi:hypothetical protein